MTHPPRIATSARSKSHIPHHCWLLTKQLPIIHSISFMKSRPTYKRRRIDWNQTIVLRPEKEIWLKCWKMWSVTVVHWKCQQVTPEKAAKKEINQIDITWVASLAGLGMECPVIGFCCSPTFSKKFQLLYASLLKIFKGLLESHK